MAEEYRREVDGKGAGIPSDLLVFAERQDCDDIAGFLLEQGRATERVAVVHLTWIGRAEQEGWPEIVVYSTFEAWIAKEVWPEAREWMSEDELASLEHDSEL